MHLVEQFIIFENAAGKTTAIPLQFISDQEQTLIERTGGKVVSQDQLTGDEVYPRGDQVPAIVVSLSQDKVTEAG